MKKTAIWQDNKPEKIEFSSQEETLHVNVAIIGGGITGISTGYFLRQNNIDCVVLEAMNVGEGTTGYSTGNLYVPVDEMLHKVESKFDAKTRDLLVNSRQKALDDIENIILEHGIECDYRKTSWYLMAETEDQTDTVTKEYEACKAAGLDAHFHKEAPPGITSLATLEVKNQAQFNPLKYIKALARITENAGCRIFENTKVLEIDKPGDEHVLETSRGKVYAKHIIHATHTPKGMMMIQTLLGPYREYALAAKYNGSFPKGIFWTRQGNHHYSIRTYTDDAGNNYIFTLGEPHKVGQKEDNQENLQKIEKYLRTRFDIESLDYYWGAQHYKSADMIPYIGSNSSDDSVFIATGYSTDGLIFGTLAGRLITDLIGKKESSWSEIYDPGRHTPLKSAKRFIKENANVAAQFIKDYPYKPEVDKLGEIQPGEAKTIELEGDKFGAYRDPAGSLHIVSTVCPHMGCIVHWNKGEKTWDCPCHGSRFTYTGKVIEGPAFHDLAKMQNKSGEV